MFQQKHKCKECDTTEGLAQCPYCGQWVCGNHRVGTGSLSDGYTCSDDAFAAELGQPKFNTIIPPKSNPPRFKKSTVLLGLILFLTSFLVCNVLRRAFDAYQETYGIIHH